MNRLFLLFISVITIGSGTHAMERLSLIEAVKAGNLEAVQQCIAQGEDIDQINNNGRTALMLAAWNGHLSVVEYLVKTGAAIDQSDNFGDAALTWAAFKGQLLVIEHLIKAGADIDKKNTHGTTALMWAAHNRHLPCCQAIVHALLRQPSLEQKKRIYEFLNSIKSNENKTIAAAYTNCILDVFKRHLRALIKEENNPRAIAEIEKIRKQEIRNQLLAFCK